MARSEKMARHNCCSGRTLFEQLHERGRDEFLHDFRRRRRVEQSLQSHVVSALHGLGAHLGEHKDVLHRARRVLAAVLRRTAGDQVEQPVSDVFTLDNAAPRLVWCDVGAWTSMKRK